MVASLFELEDAPELEPRYNIAPSTDIEAVFLGEEGRRIGTFRWGLVPSWMKEIPKAPMINARSETAAEKPMFRSAIRHRRCLIPATGFFEWRTLGGVKVPYNIGLETGGLFGMGGIWESWSGPNGEEMDSCAILTTSPNEVMQVLHDRMPVIISPQDFEAWLDPRTQALEPFFIPYQAEPMRAYSVDRRASNPRYNVPEALAPVAASLFDD